VYMSDMKTEVIVNGSWRASCDMCFQGIDEDTSSVRVLLLYCLWESTGHVHIHLLTLNLFSLFRFSSARHRRLLYVAYLHAQTDLYYIFFLSSLHSFFPVQLMTEKTEWDTYVCDNRSFILLPVFSSVHMASNATKRMKKSRHWLWSVSIVIICIQ
jgi:hypothetical protein